MEKLLKRVEKLEEIITKFAEWIHYTPPLDFELDQDLLPSSKIPSSPPPTTTGDERSGVIGVSDLSSSSPSQRSQSSLVASTSTRPQGSCRKRSSVVNKTLHGKRGKYAEYSDNSGDDNDGDQTHSQWNGEELFPYSEQIDVKIEGNEFALLPDSDEGVEDNETDDLSTFGYVESENGRQVHTERDPLAHVTTIHHDHDENYDQEEETPGIITFPSQKGTNRVMIGYKGFLYSFHFIGTGGKQIYRCSRSSNLPHPCKARIHFTPNLKGIVNDKMANSHNHPSVQGDIDERYQNWRMMEGTALHNSSGNS